LACLYRCRCVHIRLVLTVVAMLLLGSASCSVALAMPLW
jgi:hypothetical protein